MIRKIFLVVTLLLSINLNAGEVDDAKEACINNDPMACTHVGIKYLQGADIEKNATKAIEFLQKGCIGGDLKGCSAFGHLLMKGVDIEQDIDRALKIFELACDSKEYLSCSNLASLYISGTYGVKKNIPKGMDLFNKSCHGGIVESCSAYGYMLLGNHGVERDETSAKDYLKKGCEGGQDIACKQLLTMSGEKNSVLFLPMWTIITLLIGILVIIFLVVKLVGIDKIKDVFNGIWIFVLGTTFVFGWIYNIVWILDNWEHLSTITKMIDIVSIFIAPLGALFGVLHFFGI